MIRWLQWLFEAKKRYGSADPQLHCHIKPSPPVGYKWKCGGGYHRVSNLSQVRWLKSSTEEKIEKVLAWMIDIMQRR